MTPEPDEKRMQRLVATLRERADTENGPTFMGWPDRWFEGKLYRCLNDHVSVMTLLTETGDRCLACYAPVTLTFPEDKDGPL